MRAYIFACLSELVYLRLGKYELKDRDRYRLFPSDLLEKFVAADMAADVDTSIRGATDIPVTSTDTGNFVFLTFNLPCYTVIAVRGTSPYLNDWAIDLDERRIKVNRSLGYHSGFYGESKTAVPLLLKTILSSTNPLFFTGHSLGGAVASILPQIWTGPQPLMIPYAFASPRFGNEAVANKYKVYAYVRGLDPVPHLPPKASGFRSSGWPPSMVPPTDKWASGAKLLLNWKNLLPAHKIEGYRNLLGQEVSEDGFDPDVYLKLLKTRLDVAP